MLFCIFSGRQFEKTFDNAQWQKNKQMQLVKVYIFSGKPSEDTYEEACLNLLPRLCNKFNWSTINVNGKQICED